jgi:hypothetical protein
VGCINALAASGLFPPEQVEELCELLHQAPHHFQQLASRWSLQRIGQTCSWLKSYSLSGIWRVLRALRLHFKRGQQQVYSPDPLYAVKRDRAQACVQAARDHPDQTVTLYLDEFSFYRWPTPAPVYAPAGRQQPRTRLSPQFNTRGRLVVALNVVDGKILYRQRAQVDVTQQVGFLEDIRRSYPRIPRISVIQDNWHNVHFHPDQVAAAQRLDIDLVPLPTYAAWLNPVEKAGRMFRQEITHMHDQSADWLALKQRVCAFWDQFANGSRDLLRYVGLLPD